MRMLPSEKKIELTEDTDFGVLVKLYYDGVISECTIISPCLEQQEEEYIGAPGGTCIPHAPNWEKF